MRTVINTTPEGNVRIQQWIDPTGQATISAPPNKWVKTLDYTDKQYKQLKAKGPTFKTTFRLDDSALESKFLSANEIEVYLTLFSSSLIGYKRKIYGKFNRCSRCGAKYDKDVFRCKSCGCKLRTKAHRNPHSHRIE